MHYICTYWIPKYNVFFPVGSSKKKILTNTVLGHTKEYMFFPASNTFETSLDETENNSMTISNSVLFYMFYR